MSKQLKNYLDMKNILLVYGYGLKNSGDMAITEGAIDSLVARNCNIKVIMRYNKSNWEYKESIEYLYSRYNKHNVCFYECPFTLNRDSNLLKTVVNYLQGELITLGLFKAKQVEELVEWADYVFFNGGNLFRCNSFVDFARLKALFFPLDLAIKKKKPFSVLSQSAANINKAGKNKLKKIIQSSERVFVREAISYNKLVEIYPSLKGKFILGIDMAFYINKELDFMEKSTSFNNKVIAITIRTQGIGDINELEDNLKFSIINNIVKIASDLISTGYSIVLISQNVKDDEPTEYLYKKMKDKVKIIKERNPQRLREIYSNVDLLIGMRLHSIILASVVGTPSFGYFIKEWGYKNPGLMDFLSLPYSYVDESNINYSKILEIIKKKDIYKSNMKKKIEAEKESMDHFINTLLTE